MFLNAMVQKDLVLDEALLLPEELMPIADAKAKVGGRPTKLAVLSHGSALRARTGQSRPKRTDMFAMH